MPMWRARASPKSSPADSDVIEVTKSKRAEPRIPFGWVVERGLLPVGTVLQGIRKHQTAKVRADGTLLCANASRLHPSDGRACAGAGCLQWLDLLAVRDERRAGADRCAAPAAAVRAFLNGRETADRHPPSRVRRSCASPWAARPRATCSAATQSPFEFGPLGNVGDIDFGFQFEMGEAMAHDAGRAFSIPPRTAPVSAPWRVTGNSSSQGPSGGSSIEASKPLSGRLHQQHRARFVPRHKGGAALHGPRHLGRLDRQLFLDAALARQAIIRPRTICTGRPLGGADGAAQIHQGLREIPCPLRHQRRTQCSAVRSWPWAWACPRHRAARSPVRHWHPSPPVFRHRRWPRWRRRYKPPTPGSARNACGGGGKLAAHLIGDDLGGGMQVAGAGVIAKPRPGRQHVILPGIGQRRHIGPLGQELAIIVSRPPAPWSAAA